MWFIGTALAAPAETWTVAVWMDGDNNLEPYVVSDLDELERAVAPNVRIVVQADRIGGYDPRDGNWTGARRYELVSDRRRGVVSPVLEDLGEVDMGSEVELADFLLWADATAPSDHVVVVVWNHGGGFWVASDDTNGGRMTFDGELQAGLQPLVDARGAPIDVLAFDACNLQEWEAAYTLQGLTRVTTASEAWVGGKGLEYDLVFPRMPVDADAAWVGDALARSAWSAGEFTFSAVDVEGLAPLSDAIDALADAYLASPAGLDDFDTARDLAQGVDVVWDEWWMDLGSFADAAALSPDLATAAAAGRVRDELDRVVIGSYTNPPADFATGLTIFMDTRWGPWIDHYQAGPWVDNDWPTWLAAVHAAGR